MYKPLVFAHRGASSIRFENTMAAFRVAKELGADGIELDVQLTEDNIPIVIHDLELSRLAGVRKSVTTLTYKEIERIRVGTKFKRLFRGNRIPTLLDAVLFCQSNNLALNVELKESVIESPDTIKDMLALLSVINEVHISTFHYELLEIVKTYDSQMETALLIRKNSDHWSHLSSLHAADCFHIHKRLMKEPYIKQLIDTKKNIRVYGVTGNESYIVTPPHYVKGWITDYPDRF